MAKARASIPSPAELLGMLRDIAPQTNASQKPITAIINDAKFLVGHEHAVEARKEQQALINGMLVLQAHINGLERKLTQTDGLRERVKFLEVELEKYKEGYVKDVSHGFVRND